MKKKKKVNKNFAREWEEREVGKTESRNRQKYPKMV